MAAGLAAVLLAGAVLALVPGVRTAVADQLGVRGIRIVFVDDVTPTPAASPVGPNLLLGQRLTLAEARQRVSYAIHVPATLGEPDEVYVREVAGGTMVSLLYHPRPGLPEAAETGVGALLMQFEAREETEVLLKKASFDAPSVPVQINGEAGYWVIGPSSLVIDPDPSLGFDDQPGRPSANVLLWEQDGLTFRLESALSRSEALAVAETVRGPS